MAESGNFEKITVKSDLPLLNVKNINSYFDAAENKFAHFNISENALTPKIWREYFFDDRYENYPPEHWRSFAAGFTKKIESNYLKFVFEKSATYDDYRKICSLQFWILKLTKIFF